MTTMAQVCPRAFLHSDGTQVSLSHLSTLAFLLACPLGAEGAEVAEAEKQVAASTKASGAEEGTSHSSFSHS